MCKLCILPVIFIVPPLTWADLPNEPLEKGVKAFSERRCQDACENRLPLACKGYPEAQLFMAVFTVMACMLKKNPAQAAGQYEKAALQGDVDAQNEIGFLHESGLREDGTRWWKSRVTA